MHLSKKCQKIVSFLIILFMCLTNLGIGDLLSIRHAYASEVEFIDKPKGEDGTELRVDLPENKKGVTDLIVGDKVKLDIREYASPSHYVGKIKRLLSARDITFETENGEIYSMNINLPVYDKPIKSGQLGKINLPVEDISANGYVFLMKDGTVWTWGPNNYGQLGIGASTHESRDTLVQVSGLSNIIQISTGAEHVVALKSNGDVYTWGSGSSGQLGNGSTGKGVYSNVPYKVNLKNIVKVRTSSYNTFFIDSDGYVWTAGRSNAEFFNSSSSNGTPHKMQNFQLTAVDLISRQNYGEWLRPNGDIYKWDLAIGSSAKKVGNIPNVIKMTTGYSNYTYYTYYLTSDGDVYRTYSLSNGSPSKLNLPGKVIDINYTYALFDDGTIYNLKDNSEVLAYRDVTDEVELIVENPEILGVTEDNSLVALSDGTTNVLIKHNDKQVVVPFTVGKNETYTVKTQEDIDFMYSRLDDDRYSFKLETDIDGEYWYSKPIKDLNAQIDGNGHKFTSYKGSVFTNIGEKGELKNIHFVTDESSTLNPLTNTLSGKLQNVKFEIKGTHDVTDALVAETVQLGTSNDGTLVIDGLSVFGDGKLETDNSAIIKSQDGKLTLKNVLVDDVYSKKSVELVQNGNEITVKNATINSDSSTSSADYLVKGTNLTIDRLKLVGGYYNRLFGSDGEKGSVTGVYIQIVETQINNGVVYGGSSNTEPDEASFIQMYIANTGDKRTKSKFSEHTSSENHKAKLILTECYFNIPTDSYWSSSSRTINELKQRATYVGWDFINDWYMEDGSLPELRGLPEINTVDTVEVIGNPTEWTNQDVTLELVGANIISVTDYLGNPVQVDSNKWVATSNNIFIVTHDKGQFEVVVNRIDKIKPTTPVVTIQNGTITLTPSTDSLSGIKEHKYKFNDGVWMTTMPSIELLSDGQYTLYVKAIDNAGNESDVATITFIKEGSKVEEKTGTDNSQLEQEISDKLADLESLIEDLKQGYSKEKENEIGDLISSIQDLINELPDGDQKENYQNLLNDLKADFDKFVTENQTKEEIESNLQELENLLNDYIQNPAKEKEDEIRDLIDIIQDLINHLPDGSVKDNYQRALNEKENELNNAISEEELKEGITDRLSQLENLLNELRQDSNKAEEARNLIDTIQDMLNSLPEGEEKGNLQNELNRLKDELENILFEQEANKGIKISQGDIELTVGSTAQLTHNSSLPVNWSSSKPEVAAVDANGKVSAISVGTATITVTIEGTNISDSIVVTVKPALVRVEDFNIQEESLELEIGETYTLNYEIFPEEATNKKVVWTSSNPAVAAVVNGKITALANGMAVITGTTEDGGYADSITVTVKAKLTPVKIYVQPEATGWVNRLKVNVKVEGDFREILLPNGAKVYSDEFSYIIRENGNYIFTVIGKDGISTDSEVLEVENIDTEKPIITFYINPNDIKELTVNVIDKESGVDALTLPDGNTKDASELPYVVNPAQQGTYIARDKAGNISTKDYILNNVLIGNSVIHTFVGIDGIPSEWVNEDVEVRIGAQNEVDGIEDIIIEVEDKQAMGILPYMLAFNGEDLLLGGAENTLEDSSTGFIATTEVTTDEAVLENTEQDAQTEEPEETIETEEIEETEPVIKVMEDEINENNSNKVLIKSVVLSDNTTITYKVKNKYGEYVGQEVVTKIDKVDPTIEVAVDGNTVTYTAQDNLSGVRYIELPDGTVRTVNKDQQLEVSGQFTFNADGQFVISVEDYAGNRVEKVVTLTYTPSETEDENDNGATPIPPADDALTDTPSETENENDNGTAPIPPADDTLSDTPSETENENDNGAVPIPPVEDTQGKDTDNNTGSSGSGRNSSGGSGGSRRDSKADDKKYREAKEKLELNMPYTLLKGSKINWNEILGLSTKDLTVDLDTSKVGVTTAKVNLMGNKLSYKLQIVDLIKNDDVANNIPKNHWVREFALDVINKGYIVGGLNGDPMLNNTLTYADSFTAFDKLLLNNDLVKMNLGRSDVEETTKDMPEDWYTYPVKSILSKYNSKEAISHIDMKNLKQTITREEIAQVLYNSLKGKVTENRDMVSFKDFDIAKNKEALTFCVKAGILVGYDDGTIRPQGSLTRAEFMTILSKVDAILGN